MSDSIPWQRRMACSTSASGCSTARFTPSITWCTITVQSTVRSTVQSSLTHVNAAQLQAQVYTAGEFDAIAEELTPRTSIFEFNPHRDMW